MKRFLSAFLILQLIFAAYDQSLATKFAYMSSIIYQPANSITAWNCDKCKSFRDIKDITVHVDKDDNDYQAFTAYSSGLNGVIVSFRGTVPSKLSNILTDIKFFKAKYPGCSKCQVHTGFNTALKTMVSSINTAVKALLKKYPSAKVYVTGHSLGGALAAIYAMILKDDFKITPIVYTYGQPRVGNQAFVDSYNRNIPQSYRVIHRNDPVSHVPGPTAGFYHTNTEVWYDGDMKTYKLCYNEDKKCSWSISLIKYSPSDHKMEGYLQLKK